MVMEPHTRNLKCGAPFPIPFPSVELECVEFHSEIHLEFKMQAHWNGSGARIPWNIHCSFYVFNYGSET